MKKIFAVILCIVLICAMPVVVFAESEVIEAEATTPEVGVYIPGIGATLPETEETIPETEAPTPETEAPMPETETLPPMTETIPETEAVMPETEATIPTPEPTPEEEAKSVTDMIVAWIMDRVEIISCLITIILTTFYQIRKHAVLNKSIGTLNNNAVTVAESSNEAISKALAEVQTASAAVNGYKEEMTSLLTEVRANEEEKMLLKQALEDVKTYLKTARLANVELANEFAELLVLANIPNSKKEELYARHLAAVGAIADAEKTEVKEDVKQTA